ncbi:hypothetical protein [Nocardiopsis ansamitocini]|uniref:Uncharacterized protein n=1 Tax=Nocardiopsis ansamitocini TaxID=1670832 RepID=A0A9W6UJC9_9ACTN|nr:hypothetical protein [Nocardiopsis ansamitocini]GLU48378.1 hypothetical protein Nans01_27290 [Nocardiopsis ansamitocini]
MLKRLRTLAVLEMVNIPLFAVVLFGGTGMPASPANLVGFALFALLLAQGGAYWWLKSRQVRVHARSPGGMRVFRVLKRVNVLLLLAGGAVVLWSLAVGPRWSQAWPGFGLWAFAVLEHVNYFHVQLSHQTRADLARLRRTRRLHRSHLSRDMGRA